MVAAVTGEREVAVGLEAGVEEGDALYTHQRRVCRDRLLDADEREDVAGAGGFVTPPPLADCTPLPRNHCLCFT